MTSALPLVIAVDGPSGVGKGVVTRWLATRTGWHRLDSGALYRILALAAVHAGIPLDAHERVAALASDLQIQFIGETEADEAILVGGANWTHEIRAETTGNLASQIATAPVVRAALLQRQRDFRTAPGLIADGRDMGTVVFTDATLKIFLDASPEARAERRYRQLSRKGASVNLDDLFVEVRARDERDRKRTVAPLVAAPDAVVIDTTRMAVPEVLENIEKLLGSRQLDR
ncbi:(d)CMP kinase [uncultured Nevskia sp.]|uniref:(d)CMP kinase n=1 Tax=uncultured Nevskia sp. TaxID=228950 RepID=UPI0025D08DAD|nr:(d)CMP kinase [uncultured Nevskia sp.]